MKTEILHNAAAAPPVTVAGMTVLGYPISDWVQVLAGLWLLMQIGWWVYTRIIRKGRDDRQEEGRNDRGAGVASRDGGDDAR
jgi:hypothetical protein